MEQETIKNHHESCEAAKAELREKKFSGEWDNEPNRLNWSHAGMDCMLVRQPLSLHWCGYVGVKPGHPCFGKGYGEVQSGEYNCETLEYEVPAIVPDLSVHGGLTFAAACDGVVCHVTEDPADKTWWFGFDCAHSYDLSPASAAFGLAAGFYCATDGTYRNTDYARAETQRLAEQLSTLK